MLLLTMRLKIIYLDQFNLNNQPGEFRVIEVFYAGQDMLFVDMIELNETQSTLVVTQGMSFPEINNDHAEVELKKSVADQTVIIK